MLRHTGLAKMSGKAKNNSAARDIKGLLLIELENHLGNVSRACKSVDCSRSDYERFRLEDKWFDGKVADILEEKLDEAESALMKAIVGGDVSAMKFYLERKGRSRGYMAVSDVNFKGGISEDAVQSLEAFLGRRLGKQ